MPKGYIHVTYKLRCQISALRSSAYSLRAIAKKLNLNASTVSRELRRNSAGMSYYSDEANRVANRRRHRASSCAKKLTPTARTIIVNNLKLYASPEQISGRLSQTTEVNISHSSIYSLVWQDKSSGGTLYKYLRQQGKKRRKHSKSKAGVRCIPNRVDISLRPKIVDTKTRVGYWEGDTVIGANNQGVLVTLVDRHSKYVLIKKIPNKTSKETLSAVIEKMLPIKSLVHTITFDNGGEFAKHEAMSSLLGAQCYFSQPYHSWERGLNEHTNGLIRQFFPKSTNFNEVTHLQIQEVEELLNNRPRKSLNYKTPFEIFHATNEPNYNRSVALHG